jgi:hypothetical protein
MLSKTALPQPGRLSSVAIGRKDATQCADMLPSFQAVTLIMSGSSRSTKPSD